MIYNNEAEQAVLSAVLLGAITPSETELRPEHFAAAHHQSIWSICFDLDEEGIRPDIITAGDRTTDDHLIEYIADLAESGHGLTDVAAYCGIIIEKWKRRVISDEVISLSMDAADGDLDDLLARADGITERLESGSSNLAPSHRAALKDHLVELDKRAHGKTQPGISTGSRDLDDKTLGMMPTDLWVIAGRPGMGKSVVMLDIAAAACEAGPVFVFSLEMPRSRLYDRMIAAQGGVDYGKLLKGDLHQDDWQGISKATHLMHDWTLVVDDRSGLSPAQVRAASRLYKKRHGPPKVIMVDYLQIMSPGKKQDNRTNEIGYISGQLKQIAKEFNCPVVALSQLNRGVESRPDKRPRMSDLRESGAIEQDANVIVLLYRDEYYNENTEHKGVAEFIIGKQRDGETGTVYRSFIGRNQTFRDIYRGDYA